MWKCFVSQHVLIVSEVTQEAWWQNLECLLSQQSTFLRFKINQNLSSARKAKTKSLFCNLLHDLSTLMHFFFCIITTGTDPDIWPFDNLNNIEAYGNSRHEQSPVGKGLYLDGTTGTYVKLKGYDENCLAHPSNCDITIGFFLKLVPKSGWQIFFGNKDADETL